CSFMRLTEQFFFPPDYELYPFAFTPACFDYLQTPLNIELLNETESHQNVIRVLASNKSLLVGAEGLGKSYALQLLLRHLRVKKGVKCIYLANPELFFNITGITWQILFYELIFSFADPDLKKDKLDNLF